MSYNMLMAKKRLPLVVYKLFFGLLGLSAIVTEIIILIARGRFYPENFFSYFTVESNLFAAVMLIISALAILMTKQGSTLSFLRGGSTLYMMITGIVFSVLLSGLDVDLTAVPWDNIVLHYIMPIAVVVDWIIDPPEKPITFKNATLWLIFPLLYLVYSLVRGLLIDWYPYPFLNPMLEGYAGIIWVSMGILGLSLILSWLLSGVKRHSK